MYIYIYTHHPRDPKARRSMNRKKRTNPLFGRGTIFHPTRYYFRDFVCLVLPPSAVPVQPAQAQRRWFIHPTDRPTDQEDGARAQVRGPRASNRRSRYEVRGTTATRLANPWTMKDSAGFNRSSRVPFVAPFHVQSRRGVRGAVDPQQPITRPFRFNAIRKGGGLTCTLRFFHDPSTGSLLFLAIHASDTTRDITNMSVDTLDIYSFLNMLLKCHI